MIEVMNDPGPIQYLPQWTDPRRRRRTWTSLATWLVPAVILGAAVFMGAVLVGMYLQGR